MKTKRTIFDKLNTFLYGKDVRVTEGEPYTEIRDGDFSSYYPLEKYVDLDMPLPQNALDIRDFGADTNKSVEENTVAFQQAIDECSRQKGTLLVIGGIYSVTTIYLKSNITLFVEKNSGICANTDGKGYDHNTLIFAENAENITITGGGRLMGNGHLFGRKPMIENVFEPSPVIDVITMRQEYRKQIRFAHPSKYGSILITDNCKNININNVIFENSASWTYKILRCENVEIKDTVIWNNRNVANADGFDITGSSNVSIKHCFVSTADDGIVLKNAIWCGCDKEMHNITVEDCEVISRTNAFKIGTETTYDIHNVTVKNCSFLFPDLYPYSVSGISLEACDGSKVYDISIDNIKMDNCSCPLFIRLGNRNRGAEVTASTANKTEIIKKDDGSKPVHKDLFDGKSEMFNITVSNVIATNMEIPVMVVGYKQKGKTKYCTDINLKNFDLTYRDAIDVYDKRLFIPEYVDVYPECNRFRNLPSYGIWARHCKNLKIENFKCEPTKNTWRKEKILIDCI